MTTDVSDDLIQVKEAVRILRRFGLMTAAQLAAEMGCSRMRAIRLLSVAAEGDIWGPRIFQRQQGNGPLTSSLQFLYHEPPEELPLLLGAVKSLQETVQRLEARLAGATRA